MIEAILRGREDGSISNDIYNYIYNHYHINNHKYNVICDRSNIERKGGWERSNVNRSGSTGVLSFARVW